MRSPLSILFSSVGRRVELIQAFRDAAFRTNTSLKIVGTDMDMTAPALIWCDQARQVCAIRDAEYINQLLEICQDECVDLVIPTIDTDLMKLAVAREAFESIGTKVLIADYDKVALCRDKRLTGAFFEGCGLKAPKTYDNWVEYPGPYPCFIKPKDGSSSIDAFKVDTPEQLKTYACKIVDYIVQPFIMGCEYTIDVFCDYEGMLVSAVPRERLAVRSGEVLKTRICMDDQMLSEAKTIAERFHPRGPMTVQLIRDASGEDWFIEINPRYGGGAPLSMKAGARSAECAFSIARGKPCVPFYGTSVMNDAIYCRFDQSVRTDTSSDLRCVRGIAFDLDDTLYLERDYVRSGFKTVACALNDTNAESELWGYFLEGRPAIDTYIDAHGCLERKAELLDVYRFHKPDIALEPKVRELLISLRSSGYRIGIVTDGRPEGQRAKLDVLGLWNLVDDIIITDELGGPQFRKPCDIAFRILQRRWGIPFETIAYVADNPIKDFEAPARLGMPTVRVNRAGALYSYGSLSRRVRTIDCPEELTSVLSEQRLKDNDW